MEPLTAPGGGLIAMASVEDCSLGERSCAGETLGPRFPLGLVVDVVTDKEDVAVVEAPCTVPSILAVGECQLSCS
jgi:hypothetical protein